MYCIGDECPGDGRGPSRRAPPPAPFRLLRGAGLAVICAGLGYVAARPPGAPVDAAHLAIMAPPLVMVTQIAE